MWANSGREISLPGLVVSFPDEDKRSINTTGKIRKVPFAVLQENSGQILLVSANRCSLHWRQRQKSTLKWLNICYTYGSVAFQFFYYSVLSYFQVTRVFYSACSQHPSSHRRQRLVCVEGKEDAGLLAHLTADRGQCPKAVVAAEQPGGAPPARQGAPGVVPCLYKPPSASAVLRLRGLKLGRVKLWPKAVQPSLLCTRGRPGNVIVMTFSEERIGYLLYWGHLSVRHLALFLVSTWAATDDRGCCSLVSRASGICRC